MIYDKIENMGLYFNDIKAFHKVEKAYREFCEAPFESGKIEIDGENAWCNVSKYTLEPDAPLKYEAHKKYADVQVMFDGEENIGWANIEDCNITEDFKPDNDIAFMDAPNGQLLPLKKGYFMVFFPQDAHAPCRKSENSEFSHKLVFKIKL